MESKRIKLSESVIASLVAPSQNVNAFLQLTYNSKPTASFIDYEQPGILYPTTSRSSLIRHTPKDGDEWVVTWQGKKETAWKGQAHSNANEFVLIPDGDVLRMERRVVLHQLETLRDGVPPAPPPVSVPLVKNASKSSKSSQPAKPEPAKPTANSETKEPLNVNTHVPTLHLERLASPYVPSSRSPSLQSTNSKNSTDLDLMALEFEKEWDDELSEVQSQASNAHTPGSIVYDNFDD